MKKALLALIGAGVVASVASLAVAQDAAVANSANAVGVLKYTIPANGELVCISFPMNCMDDVYVDGVLQPEGSWAWTNNSVSAQMPANSMAYFWDVERETWQSSTKGGRGWNGVGAKKVLSPGEAFFLQGPSGCEEFQVSLLGELPTDEVSYYAVRGGGNLDPRTVSMYPVEVAFTNSGVASNLVNNSQVFVWEGGTWQASTKGGRGWNGVARSRTIKVGEGIFVKSADDDPSEISSGRPFAW